MQLFRIPSDYRLLLLLY